VREEGGVRGGVGIDVRQRRHREGFYKIEYGSLEQAFWESNLDIVAQRPV